MGRNFFGGLFGIPVPAFQPAPASLVPLPNLTAGLLFLLPTSADRKTIFLAPRLGDRGFARKMSPHPTSEKLRNQNSIKKVRRTK
jgi:hypothetical protein